MFRLPRKSLVLICLALATTACSIVAKHAIDKRYGVQAVRDRSVSPSSDNAKNAAIQYQQVRDILDKRCVSCHACYDAPCQVQLGSAQGMDRGANKSPVYNTTRLLAADPTRLFVDATTTEQWRSREFFPIMNERHQDRATNLQASVLYRMLELKQNNPTTPGTLLPDDLRIGTEGGHYCARLDEFDAFARNHPQRGMPYGLPGLPEDEFDRLAAWLGSGARHVEPAPLAPDIQQQVERWESFLNQQSKKVRLMSRYLYEHLFLAHLYFDNGAEEKDAGNLPFFRLVRSLTPPGEPIRIIASRRPFDTPGTDRFYYRLWRERSTLVAKTHMPFRLNAKRMRRWQSLFLDHAGEVSELPGYEPHVAANPFVSFRDIPVDARYRFMLDEAQFFIMGFIKGPVCRGQVALNVINDHFWVFFVNPDHPSVGRSTRLLDEYSDLLSMPIEQGSNASPLSIWTHYAALQKEHIARSEKFLSTEFTSREELKLDLVWDGNTNNDNAALTVFRHLDNATVEKGMIGDHPQTAWLIGYPLFERIHYLLVAGYDVYGNIGHNLNARLYMDFLRMEGEFFFLSLLPRDDRVKERNTWYRNAQREVSEFIRVDRHHFSAPSHVDYQTNAPKAELFELIRTRLARVLSTRHDINPAQPNQVQSRELQRLAQIKGEALMHLPEFSYLTVVDTGKQRTLSLVRNTALANVASLFGEQSRRLPKEDTLTVANGFLGAYPNALFRVPVEQLKDFVDGVQALDSSEAYMALKKRFGVARTSPDFWQHSDAILASFKSGFPVEYGILDYNRLENR